MTGILNILNVNAELHERLYLLPQMQTPRRQFWLERVSVSCSRCGRAMKCVESRSKSISA